MTSNGKKIVGVTSTIMATLIVVGVGAVFKMSVTSGANQREHEMARDAHNVDKIEDAVSDIADSMSEIAKQQIRQTTVMENMRDDISEIKEAQP